MSNEIILTPMWDILLTLYWRQRANKQCQLGITSVEDYGTAFLSIPGEDHDLHRLCHSEIHQDRSWQCQGRLKTELWWIGFWSNKSCSATDNERQDNLGLSVSSPQFKMRTNHNNCTYNFGLWNLQCRRNIVSTREDAWGACGNIVLFPTLNYNGNHPFTKELVYVLEKLLSEEAL